MIIPTLNEAENIGKLVRRLKSCNDPQLCEILVIDADSTDDTQYIAEKAGARVFSAQKKGRGPQMNYGATLASGDYLYFVHGDALPPSNYFANIAQAINNGSQIGGFRFTFDSDKTLLKFNSYCTRFNKIFVRGGDQTMYVKRDLFEELDGFREDFQIMEDYDFIERAQERTPFKVIQNDVVVSARKYDNNSWLRVQIANIVIFSMYRLGYSQSKMVNAYKKLLDYRY